ncbi:hypothetical protein BV898_14149 [Hypsibius exemplaris]|uniref:Uncharacterized protein n=1 Tax=Hypsibius exemplaris TaxID=2072580 RepID=A0A1W0W8R1_HYPEX|nr:hypothetical protein BV898_14149 [Hypsibius exemplaris]
MKAARRVLTGEMPDGINILTCQETVASGRANTRSQTAVRKKQFTVYPVGRPASSACLGVVKSSFAYIFSSLLNDRKCNFDERTVLTRNRFFRFIELLDVRSFNWVQENVDPLIVSKFV